MKAAYINRTGPPEVIEYGDLPDPKPAPTQVLIKVGAVDINPIETYIRSGAVTTPLIGSDGTVYAGSADEHLYALTVSGTLLFAVTVKGRAQGALANTSGPTLYVATDTGLAAIGP